ncbi:MAG: hypothetical protein HOE90_06225 [Bacteriovoracaceae bacterium]|jgi:shikimate dehydrogenase|nr:hypothetical protein [Bacteriovoracaceae bacterium]
MNLALLGKDISHSRSPEIYEKISGGTVNYKLLDYPTAGDIPQIETLFSENNLDGLSITAPYKRVYLDHVQIEDPLVKKLDCINAIAQSDDGFFATNTDWLALCSLFPKYFTNSFDHVVLLGDGSMSKMTAEYLSEKKISFEVVSRKAGNLNSDFFTQKCHPVFLINCISRNYLFEFTLPSGSIFWDYNYNRPEQKDKILKCSSSYIDGFEFLYSQGEHAYKFFTNING